MHVTILMGSPRLTGNTDKLCRALEEGAREAGHTVTRFDVAALSIAPCTQAFLTGLFAGTPDNSDGMDAVLDSILKSGAVVFATPVYYLGMTAQLKTVIDRFCAAPMNKLTPAPQAVLLASAGSPDPAVFTPLVTHMEALCAHLGWPVTHTVLAGGIGATPIESGDWLARARAAGAALGQA